MGVLLMLDSSDDVKTVGQLGSYLSKIKRAGLKVARGFVVPINRHVGYGLSNEILREFDRLQLEQVILRASPVHDVTEVTIAGPIGREQLIEAVAQMQINTESHWRPSAIIVQEYLDGELCGRIHSQNPYTEARDEIVLETRLWVKNSVLGGEEEDEMIIIDKRDGSVELESEEEESILDADQVEQLFRAVRKAEKAIDAPISLDWAFVNGVLYILRARSLSA